MSPKVLFATTVLTLTGFTATTALAAQGEGPRGPKQPPLRAAVMFNMLDANNDGNLDAAELETVTSAIISAVDADGDGVLSQDEVGQVMRGFGPRGGRDHAGRGPRGGKNGQHMGRGGRGGPQFGQNEGRGPRGGQFRERMAERLGIDEDGLTQDEFLQHQSDRFAEIDADGDGVVTQEEFAQARMGPRDPRSAR